MTEDQAPTEVGVTQGRDSAGERAAPGLSRQLSELARTLQAEPDTEALLHHIVRAAVEEIPSAEHAGITLTGHDSIVTPAATSDLVSRIDTVQLETRQGPCVSTGREHATMRVDDLSADQRWPKFAEAVVGIGVHSVLSFQLFVEEKNFGALNLYAESPHAFDSDDENIGLLLASHAAVALAAARTEANLTVALTNRDVIGQAKGILMERYKITAQQAFNLLVTASQHRNVKLHQIAEELVASGELQGI
ncbi:GAF and ANTAR domain-containing protein [Tsukamurella sp. 8F]|uniref:GAF and ANTAR domain-containing protein n=1 Tax=unclassified Tsukamurella TaxID=2633480 RepID=UPI0023B948DD|nr:MULTISPECIES: GAF and ANTAR domain-containing protein [unclassified Tsukamurella]MDF0531367.1 GAF and ANTAR domain-containing protein [Tsukamurella sp. 8J]MDF0588573.1 GAF and ANTAR domain-containing protein [Tsukamurella sp. 8F]